VIDEDSRLCQAIRVGRSCRALDVVAVLEELTRLHTTPAFIQSDNDPAFKCFAEALRLRAWSEALK
jgi:hypothetical protein